MSHSLRAIITVILAMSARAIDWHGLRSSASSEASSGAMRSLAALYLELMLSLPTSRRPSGNLGWRAAQVASSLVSWLAPFSGQAGAELTALRVLEFLYWAWCGEAAFATKSDIENCHIRFGIAVACSDLLMIEDCLTDAFPRFTNSGSKPHHV